MNRIVTLLSLALLAGCVQPPEDPSAGDQTDRNDPGIQFDGWPKVTDKPFRVEPISIFELCAPPATPVELREMEAHRQAEREKHGPHYQPSIVVRVRPADVDAFRARRPLPVGATVVKEKHADTAAAEPANEYTAMIKREAGYDSVNGDWEYLHVVREPVRRVTRGRLSNCIDCHQSAKRTDYLFRTYLNAPTER